MRQFFVSERPTIGSFVPLDPSDSHHLLRVLRKEEGALLQVAYEGEQFRGRLKIVEDKALVAIDEKVEVKDIKARLILAQGVGKSQKTETVLKHATECGIDGFIPIQTDRSVSNLSKKYDAKRKRFETIAEEAAKQSNRTVVPTIGDLMTVDDLVQSLGKGDRLIVCYEGEVRDDILDLRLEGEGTVYVLIGAEGGLSPREVDVLEKNGATFVTMGPSILRTETAGVVAAYVVARLIERGIG